MLTAKANPYFPRGDLNHVKIITLPDDTNIFSHSGCDLLTRRALYQRVRHLKARRERPEKTYSHIVRTEIGGLIAVY